MKEQMKSGGKGDCGGQTKKPVSGAAGSQKVKGGATLQGGTMKGVGARPQTSGSKGG